MNVRQKLTEKFIESKRFIQFVVTHFFADDCTYRASALAFTTLLAIVPLMSVGFAVLSSFTVFHNLAGSAQDFIFENFIPATGKVIQNYLSIFTQQVSKLSLTGVSFLFVAAILVMYTIESSLNNIWRVKRSRNGIYAFLLYWAIISLTPVFLGISLALSSYIFSMPFIMSHPTTKILNFIPFSCSLIGFSFLYIVVPNCKVRFSHGFYGGLIAAILFEAAKNSFAYYLVRFDTYQLLYGAFATIPIFFIWVYWVWIITLFGAEISYAFSMHYQRRRGKALDGFTHALLWLRILWLAQQKGTSVPLDLLINASNRPYDVEVGEMLSLLTNINLLKTTKSRRLILSRNINNMTLFELSRILPFPLPDPKSMICKKTPITMQWSEKLTQVDEKLQDVLALNLNQFIDG